MNAVMKVAVGSKNPVKIEAVKRAFEIIWPEKKWDVLGVEVSSGVSNQPMSDLESIKGATTRAKRAIKALKADFGVGLEGGLQKIKKDWFDCGWIVVINKNAITRTTAYRDGVIAALSYFLHTHLF